MFTIEQIKNAHSKVKSGADFPSYIREIKTLGVKQYHVKVENGNAVYSDGETHQVESGAKYELLTLSNIPNVEQFKLDLKAHQQGKTDYLTFCNDCAKSGIDKWVISLEKMTCTYYDILGNEVLVEQIPS